MRPVIAAAAFALVLSLGSLYEVWGVWMEGKTGRPHAITSLVKIHTHLSIIIGGGLFTLFGYVLGGGSG